MYTLTVGKYILYYKLTYYLGIHKILYFKSELIALLNYRLFVLEFYKATEENFIKR